jgi:hypothetical protein
VSVNRPIAAGVGAAFRNRRLAYVLWLGLVLTAGITWLSLGSLTAPFDESPFRETTVRGWDSWGMLTWIALRPRDWAFFLRSVATALLAGVFLQLFLTGGILRVLVSGVPRPAFRRVVAEGAALFRPSLWAAARWLVGLAVWGGIFVAVPLWLFRTFAGPDAPPNDGWTALSEFWAVTVGLLVLLLVTLKFDLARVALARDEARNARGGYRVAKRRLKGARGRAIGIALFWMAAGVAIQALFTNLGVRMNPQTSGGLALLVAVRQLGFVLSAMARVGFWASLLRFDESRREEDAPPQPVLSPLAAYPRSGEAPETAAI